MDVTPTPDEITLLLQQWKHGKSDALAKLLPSVYQSLRALAVSQLRAERPGHTLQATALVHELYLRLLQQQKLEWKDRSHFFAFAARLMRLILIDHARAVRAQKRGGGEPLALLPDVPWFDATPAAFLDLEQALLELEQLDPEKGRIVEIRFYLGCTGDETAEMLGCSRATVEREWKFIRGWLFHRLNGRAPASAP